ncbi:hypothetical protein JXQ31_07680 [candidate division KSB1 bacterium]|nr:hypothetical protein [candidate division KSB1 bacterium]
MDRRRTQKKRQRKTSVIPGMDDNDVLQQLETLAINLGLEIRAEKGDFKSGYCRVNDQNLIILKKDDSFEKKIELITDKLTEYPHEKLEIHPAIRQLIEQKKSEMNSLNGSKEE